ncbi:hypothetical protein HDU92_000933 [Lobulomyces angularis]|nr:hypothetical protein HDU92_000933 [Lobulomyces angularis]
MSSQLPILRVPTSLCVLTLATLHRYEKIQRSMSENGQIKKSTKIILNSIKVISVFTILFRLSLSFVNFQSEQLKRVLELIAYGVIGVFATSIDVIFNILMITCVFNLLKKEQQGFVTQLMITKLRRTLIGMFISTSILDFVSIGLYSISKSLNVSNICQSLVSLHVWISIMLLKKIYNIVNDINSQHKV